MPKNARITHINKLDFSSLLEYFEIELATLNRSRATKKIYLSSIRLYLRWLDENGHEPVVERRLVQAWMAELLERGAAPTTVAARLAGVRQFSKWLANENEIPADPLLRLNAPKAPMPITKVLAWAR
jgi:site-specific recombinase XerD